MGVEPGRCPLKLLGQNSRKGNQQIDRSERQWQDVMK